ncbi:hypothetical protein BDV10DRAFT_143871 [Aspergillus recurvatus]
MYRQTGVYPGVLTIAFGVVWFPGGSDTSFLHLAYGLAIIEQMTYRIYPGIKVHISVMTSYTVLRNTLR